MHRIEYSSFLKLCTIISHQVQVNDEMSRHRSGMDSISVDMMLHCLVWWLGGGSYLDIRLSTGISKAAFYGCIYKCIDAIKDAEDLADKFPDTAKELYEAAQGFESLRSQEKSSFRQWDRQYQGIFSGHYQTCDHKCRLVYAALAAPGGQMTLQHWERRKSVRWFKSCHWEDLSLVTMHMLALRLH